MGIKNNIIYSFSFIGESFERKYLCYSNNIHKFAAGIKNIMKYKT